MRSEDEVQRAHDLFAGILITSSVHSLFKPEELRIMQAHADVLCWMLRHKHNRALEAVMRAIEEILREHGLELREEDAEDARAN